MCVSLQTCLIAVAAESKPTIIYNMHYWRGTICVQGGPCIAGTTGPGGPFIPGTDGPGGPLTRGTVSSMTVQRISVAFERRVSRRVSREVARSVPVITA